MSFTVRRFVSSCVSAYISSADQGDCLHKAMEPMCSIVFQRQATKIDETRDRPVAPPQRTQ